MTDRQTPERTTTDLLRDYLEGVEWNGPKDEFYEHAVMATSQYDKQYRAMATEILAARQAIRLAAAALASRAAAPQEQSEDAQVVNAVTAAMREADRKFSPAAEGQE